MELFGKQNQDGSFSVSVRARDLVKVGWVDFYDESTGIGYQRKESMRESRARSIEDYFKRCVSEGQMPRLFELTASARGQSAVDTVAVEFDPLDERERLGIVTVHTDAKPWLSLVDGGTRLRGIQRAVLSGAISGETFFDVRLFGNLSLPEEIALFLLINENQKKVRTDLSLRVVQRALDDGDLTDEQHGVIRTVVPDTEKWRYDASRIAARLNSDQDSSFAGLVQMPGESAAGKPITMQAFWTSLKHMLDDDDLTARIDAIDAIGNATEFWVRVLKNFWAAVAETNPDARAEPKTTVLWGSIGVNGCHRALARIVQSELSADRVDLRRERLMTMIADSEIANYAYWFSRKGGRSIQYPSEKGEATNMTGNSGYIRLASILEEQWRSNLHAASSLKVIDLG